MTVRVFQRGGGGPGIVLDEADLHPQHFRTRDAQLLVESGAPHLRVFDAEGAGYVSGVATSHLRVPYWVGRLWLKLPSGSEVVYMRRLLADEELRAAALSVLELSRSPSLSLEELVEAALRGGA